MKKIAKMRIPFDKMDGVSDVWVSNKIEGPWSAHVYEDEKAFMRSERVLVIEGDSEVINPVVTTIMEILTS